jgi:hypothetical protein
LAEPADIPPEIVTALRTVCGGLPETYEEAAWTGRRWCVRRRTFAHVLSVEQGSPRAHAVAAGSDGPVVVLVFRSAGEELDVLAAAGHPFFKAGWGSNVMGMVLDGGTDWDEVGELLTESYCVQAPKKLVALVARPEAG